MRRDQLLKLLQLRRMEVNAARAELLAAEVTAREARQAVRDAQSMLRHEMAAACSVAADDGAAEAFAKWLPIGRAAQTRAEAQLQRVEENLFRIRTAFNLSSSAAESVEMLINDQHTTQIRAEQAAEQLHLDEISLRKIL